MCEFLCDSDVDREEDKCLGRVMGLGCAVQCIRSYAHADVSIKIPPKNQFIASTIFICHTKHLYVGWWAQYKAKNFHIHRNPIIL